MKRLALVVTLLATSALAQEEPVTGDDQPEFTESDGAQLRFLDKLTSATGDVELSLGQSAKFGRLIVQLNHCRYLTANPSADSQAHLTIVDETTGAVNFSGWMLASAPALSALDHPRYDVWVLTCVLPESAEATSEGEGE